MTFFCGFAFDCCRRLLREALISLRRESDLSNQGYYLLAQELVYQWLGSWVTPQWWTDAHVNKAIAGFLAASTANEVNYIVFAENDSM